MEDIENIEKETNKIIKYKKRHLNNDIAAILCITINNNLRYINYYYNMLTKDSYY